MTVAAKLRIAQTGEPDELDQLRKAAHELPADRLPDFIGGLEAVKALAWSRLTSPATTTMQQEHDELLDVEAAAGRLGISKDYLYRHHRRYPFTRRQGRRLLFSAVGIDKHIRKGS